MNRYDVKITEVLRTTISVEAMEADEAEDKAREKYRSCEVILDADDLVDTNFLVTGSSEKLTGSHCSCGNNHFLIDELSEATVTVTFINGEMTVVKGGDSSLSIEYIGLLKCKACGKAYEKEK